MIKIVATASTVLVSLGLAVFFQPPTASGQPPPKAKKGDPKKKGGPGGELRKAYDLLRRLRAEDGNGPGGRPDERLRDWTDRASGLYRDGVKAQNAVDPRPAREYGHAAHDLARAIDHARNASRFDRRDRDRDPDLPPPPDDFGPGDTHERARRDLSRAYERLGALDDWRSVPDFAFYTRSARDLYGAARRDLEAGRDERGGELARAAEAMTHVPEHLARAVEDRGRGGFLSEPPPPPDGRPAPRGGRPGPDDFRRSELPPPLPPG